MLELSFLAEQQSAEQERQVSSAAEAEHSEAEVCSEQRWLAAFRRLEDDGQVHRDSLIPGLELAGFPRPDPELTEEVLVSDGLTRYNTLDLGEFVRFLRGYEAKMLRQWEEAFELHDAAQSGTIELADLGAALKACGVAPPAEVIAEVSAEVDERGTQRLTLVEFRHVLEILSSREGFSRQDTARFRRAFTKFDRDSLGLVSAHDMPNILTWLGYCTNQQDVEEVLQEVSSPSSDDLNKFQFVVFLRKIHEREVDRVWKLLKEITDDADNWETKFIVIFRALGYFVDSEAISDVAQDIGLFSTPTAAATGKSKRSKNSKRALSVSLSEFWRVLDLYRAREGFSRSEIAETERAFQRYHHGGGAGEISTLHVGKVLRWLALPTTYEVQQQLVAEVDVDKSGQLDLSDLMRLVRKCREQEVLKMKLTFEEYDPEASGVLSQRQCQYALLSLGRVLHLGDVRDGTATVAACGEDADTEALWVKCGGKSKSKPGVDVYEFVETASRLRKYARQAVRETAGFSSKEAKDMQQVFEKYDFDHSGEISNLELRSLLQDVFPEISTTAEQRPILIRILAEIDADGNGEFDFPDFLRLMRQFIDLKEQAQLEKEHQAVRTTRFTAEEVEEFRELFLSKAKKDRLSFDALKKMIGSICSLREGQLPALATVFHAVSGEDVKDGSLTFPDFLLVMCRLLDANFANLKESTQRIAEQQKAA